jgi:hypothetical protein
MIKSVGLLLMALIMSGCCELFGICTSVNVHTSATAPDKFADSNLDNALSPTLWPGGPQSGVTPASAIVANPHYLPPIEP